jgi:hypothetical protein
MAAFLPGEGLLLGIVAVLALVGLAVFLWPAVRAYRLARGTRVVTCPATQEPAAIELDVVEAMAAAVGGRGPALAIEACTRWPEHAHCGQACLAQVEAAPAACLARTMIAGWYAARACALCGRRFDDGEPLTHAPALRAPDGTTRDWTDVPAETIPDVFATHLPVCWNCHVAETFRRSCPELVTDRRAWPERHC